jgi:hypothetical protein
MSWNRGHGVDASIGLRVGHDEKMALRLNMDGGAYLCIGSAVEILLTQDHVVSLREQSGVVEADLLALESAEDAVSDVRAVGTRATNTVEYARQQAEVAMAAGATREARDALEASDKAAEAAALVERTVTAALAAIDTADIAIDAAGEAAAAAARAAGKTTPPPDNHRRTLRLA